MANTYPGMTVEVSRLEKGSSRILFDGIFATGGITLSQVSVMTGLEPYMIQNWVKRGFVTSSVKRMYSKKQFARIVIINMLRESLQIDRICDLIKIIAGRPNDESDDLISDDELYHHYVDMLAEGDVNPLDGNSVAFAAERAAKTCEERIPNTKKCLQHIFTVMVYAHTASELRKKADEEMAMLQ